MGKSAIGCLIVAGLVVLGLVLIGFWAVGQFNGLVAAQEVVEQQWAQVETVYQRRADLIPNLVATVQGASEFEQETLNQVVEARSRVGQMSVEAGADIINNPEAFAQFQQTQDALSSALQRLLVVVERYPELKSVAAYQDLMVQLEGTENRISVERNRYNQAARDFNVMAKRIPTRWLISWLGWDFPDKAYFSSQPGAETAPAVEF
jgi:LemA protein